MGVFKMELNKIYCMDNLDGMKKYLPDESIDLTVTSPPYDNLRKYKGFTWDFEGVVKHYQALAYAGSEVDEPNPFFFVSSSEWNLYNFIVEFSRNNQLPDGVFLLSQLKNFSQVFKTGSNKSVSKIFFNWSRS